MVVVTRSNGHTSIFLLVVFFVPEDHHFSYIPYQPRPPVVDQFFRRWQRLPVYVPPVLAVLPSDGEPTR